MFVLEGIVDVSTSSSRQSGVLKSNCLHYLLSLRHYIIYFKNHIPEGIQLYLTSRKPHVRISYDSVVKWSASVIMIVRYVP